MLTREQLTAITSDAGGAFIEAHPGSGKTVVAAERFGVLRFGQAAASDARAVVAMSFTRAATRELRRRVIQRWGTSTLQWPHRVVTVDTVLRELLDWLLSEGHLRWPGERTELTVYDSWRAAGDTTNGLFQPAVRWRDGEMHLVRQRLDKHRAVPTLGVFRAALERGECTHDEVRASMQHSLTHEGLRSLVEERLRETIRGLIVDEVFDANELDLDLLAASLRAGVSTTLIGDPWQALYEFRGARPREVRALTARDDVVVLPLTASFRWRSDKQSELARGLRASEPVELPVGTAGAADVVLGHEWKALWEADEQILPLAFGSARADLPYAGATLVLSHLTLNRFGLPSPFVRDARITLRLTERADLADAQRWVDTMCQRLTSSSAYDARLAYADMSRELGEIIGRPFPDRHWTRERYFKWLKLRLTSDEVLVPGLTVHQAKGQEWDRVALVLTDAERAVLSTGLDAHQTVHRRVYVGCTRARSHTTQLP